MLRLALATLSALLLLAGCASYQVGSPGDVPYRTVYVAPPTNETTLPQLEAPVNVALRKAITQSGKISLANAGDAETELRIRLVEAKRDIEAVQSADVGRARKIALRLEVAVSLRRAGAAEDYLIRDHHFFVSQEVFLDSGQIEAEYQATPELAGKVAQKVADLLLDTW